MRVLVVGAGGPAGVNTCRALAEAGHEVFAEDQNAAHLVFADEYANRWDGEDVDVVVPQPDSLVRSLTEDDSGYPGATFLPPWETVRACQEKGTTAALWHHAGLRGPVVKVTEPRPDWLHIAADTFGLPFWLRAEIGAGANKAVKVNDLRTAYHWIRFWETRDERVSWIAEPYLPGRDLAWTSIWYQGELVACFLRERLEYLYPHLSPEGLTGTPTIARILPGGHAATVATQAVLTIDPKPHGIFSVDLREDADGTARPTEINAGRGFTTMGLWSLYDVNFTALAAELAVREPTETFIDPLPEGLTLSRHIDCGWTFARESVAA